MEVASQFSRQVFTLCYNPPLGCCKALRALIPCPHEHRTCRRFAPLRRRPLNTVPAFDIELPPVQRVVTCTVLGIVQQEDLARLVAAGSRPLRHGDGSTTHSGDLARIKEQHHAVARLIASGLSQTLVASITGYTQSYMSVLLNNPAMTELVSHYRAQLTNGAEVVAERLKHIALKAVDALAEDLEAGELDANEKLALAKLGLDRSGHGPHSKVSTVTEHHLFDHAELQRMNREARRASDADIIRQALPAPAIEIDDIEEAD